MKINRNLLRQAGLVTGGICIGSGMTYLIMNKRLETKYVQIANESIDRQLSWIDQNAQLVDELGYDSKTEVSSEEPAIYNELVQSPDDEDEGESLIAVNSEPELEAGKQLVERLLNQATDVVNYEVLPPKEAQKILTLDDVSASPADIPESVTGEQPMVSSKKVNIFTDYKEPSPEALRDRSVPYLVATSEFYVEDDEFTKITLHYYAGDGVLADDRNKLVPDIEGTVGAENLEHFGYLDDDPEVIYVRNHKRNADFEVLRDMRTFAEAAFGADREG